VSDPLAIAVIEPDPRGGLLHYATQLADALAERGNQVTLVVARENELSRRTGPARRLEVLAPDPPPAPDEPSRVQVLARRARTAARIASTWWRILREVRRGGYDVVLLGGSIDLTLTATAGLLFVLAKGRTPVAHVCHNVRPFNRWGGDELYIEGGPTIALLRRLYPRFELVFLHGERSRAEFSQTWPEVALAVIPHGDEGLFVDEPPPPAPEPRVLFFGNWSKVKGLGVLMQAFDLLAERRPDARLTIAGPPAEEAEAAAVLAWASGRTERVELMPGYVPVEDVPGLFARARVVVLPYLTVYQSGVVHLAMTMRRAVVVTDVGELASAVADGESGLVVPARDPAALADALHRVLSDPMLAERMGAEGRRRVQERSSWTIVAERVEAELRQLVGDP
jgi:glycosyltransferase involved in cell wall biosynthesis